MIKVAETKYYISRKDLELVLLGSPRPIHTTDVNGCHAAGELALERES